MDIQIDIIEDTSAFLAGLVNYIDRTKTTMINSYPNWDEQDVAEFKTAAITNLNIAIAKLSAL
jgi:hypothetical protein